jgi:hypothetical protein
MTDYERFSLRLLSQIAIGIGLQLISEMTPPTDTLSPKQDREESIRQWHDHLTGLLGEISQTEKQDEELRSGAVSALSASMRPFGSR